MEAERTYRTSEVAEIVGVHPNTVRLYEKWRLISPALRTKGGYRVFTGLQIAQFRLARRAFEIEVLQNGLRKKIISAVKCAAQRDFEGAEGLTCEYIDMFSGEKQNAREAVAITRELLRGGAQNNDGIYKRAEIAKKLGVSIDALRNWEANGLLCVKRRENGYRVYTGNDLRRLKIIRSLKCAGYSLSAILRMLTALSGENEVDIEGVLNTPRADEDIISACDRLIISLERAEENARAMLEMLAAMKKIY